MKLLLTIIFSVAVFLGHAQKQLVIDENAELREVKGNFSALKVSGGITVYISQSDTVAIAVSAAAEKHRQYIKTEIVNEQLNIYFDGGKSLNWRSKKIVVYVAFKSLHKITASGASDVVVAGALKSDHLTVDLSGSSDFAGEVQLNSLSIELSGASDVSLNGKVANLDIASSGASDVSAYSLIADTCKASASGASDIEITVGKELFAEASGASHIYYKGNPNIQRSAQSGASSIKPRG